MASSVRLVVEMPTRAARVCRVPGCGRVTVRSDGYCTECSDAGKNTSIEDRRKKETDPFYYSTEWRRYQKWWLMTHPLCVSCGQSGQMVDHKVPIRDGGAKLNPANTQTMCFTCHNKKTGSERAAKNSRRAR